MLCFGRFSIRYILLVGFFWLFFVILFFNFIFLVKYVDIKLKVGNKVCVVCFFYIINIWCECILISCEVCIWIRKMIVILINCICIIVGSY